MPGSRISGWWLFPRNAGDRRLRRELIISYSAHVFFVFIAFLLSAFSRPTKPPETVYSVRIIAAPQAKTIDKPEVERKPEPRPAVDAIPEPEPTRIKPEPKPAKKPRVEPKKTSPTGTGHITIDGSDFRDDFYLNLIYMKVYRNWIPPPGGRELKAVIYFRITRDGQVKNAKVEKRSSSANFDQKALRTILVSSPFPELPEDYSGDHLGIHFEFEHNP